MTCEEVAKRLSDDVDGELPPRERLALRLHLLMCRRCRVMRRSLQRTVRLLRRLAETTDPGPASEHPID